MDPSLRVIVEWPNGSRLPVRISPSATGEDLAKLLRFSFDPDSDSLMRDGCLVKPRRVLIHQQIHQNQIIKVIHTPKRRITGDSSDESEGESSAADCVYNEVRRLGDIQFNAIEGHRKGGIIMGSFLKEQDESDDSLVDCSVTNCHETTRNIRKDPLPSLPDDDWEW